LLNSDMWEILQLCTWISSSI